MKIITLCDPLWFNLPYHNQILWKSEKVHTTRITRELKILLFGSSQSRIINPNKIHNVSGNTP